MRPQERDELVQHRKLEAINAKLEQHRRMARTTLLLLVVLNVVALALLIYHLLGHD